MQLKSKQIKSRLTELSGDRKSVLTLMGGTTIAQALNFLFFPIQTRLFSPAVFGQLSVFTSITGIVGVIVCLRYELAIILPKKDDEAFSLYKLSILFAGMVSILTGFIFFFEGKEIYQSFGAQELQKYWYYVPINLLSGGFILASNYWLTRRRQFKILSLNKVIPVLAVNIVSIALGLFGKIDIGARLFAILISNFINVLVLVKPIMQSYRNNNSAKLLEIIYLIKSYKNFLVYDIWSALLNNLSWMIVPILMNSFFSSYEAGQYSISLRVIQLPMTILGGAYAQVFFKNASEKYYMGELYELTIATLKRLARIVLPFFLIFILLGDRIFVLLFGNQWQMGGRFTQILSLYMVTAFIASPISTVLTIVGKQNISLVFNFVVLALRVISLLIAKMANDCYLGMILFSITGFFFNLYNIFYFIKASKKSDIIMKEKVSNGYH